MALIMALALGLLCAPLAPEAQPPARVPRLGILYPRPLPDPFIEAFWQGLRELGYLEGQTIALEYRSAEGKAERLPGLAAELVRLHVDVIVTGSTPGALAAKGATQTIPVVIGAMGDAVESGVVASLARPGGNITGLSLAQSEAFTGKWVELLKEAVPPLSRVAVLRDPTNPGSAAQVRGIQNAAPALGVMLQSLELQDPKALEHAFAAMSRERAEALIVIPEPPFFAYRTQIVALAAESRLPTMYAMRDYVEAGGLMSYGPSYPAMYRRAAVFVDKILKGAKPADLPVEQPLKFELVLNLKTAQAPGLTIPPSVLFQADEVIR
jgi:putative ABC transport system substrate-binding protein